MIKEYFVSNKACIVSRGEYSDYYIVGVFSSKEKAKEYIDRVCKEKDWFTPDCFDIEEFIINEGSI